MFKTKKDNWSGIFGIWFFFSHLPSKLLASFLDEICIYLLKNAERDGDKMQKIFYADEYSLREIAIFLLNGKHFVMIEKNSK